MARARNIKPGFFTNDRLVDLPFSTRLLFIGLWTIADREGRVEDRPKKIKMEIFPADDVDVDEALSTLVSSAFIQRYRVGELACIQVVNFSKHQRPHSNETASTLPPPPAPAGKSEDGADENPSVYAGVSETSDLGSKDLSPRGKALRPDTGYLNDESPIRIPDTKTNARTRDVRKPTPVDAVAVAPDEPAGERKPTPGWQMLAAVWQEQSADPAALPRSERAKQLRVASRMIQSGYTATDAASVTRWILAQGWLTSAVDLFMVEKQIAKWEIAGRPDGTRPIRAAQGTTPDAFEIVRQRLRAQNTVIETRGVVVNE